MGRLAPAVGIIIAIIAVAAVFGAFALGEPESQSDSTSIKDYLVTEAVKPVVVRDKNEQKVTLDSSMADKSLVTFWDATCAECRTGLPMIASFVAAHPEIKPIYINHQNTREQAEAALKEWGLAIETHYDTDGSAFNAWSGTTPATYYIRNGIFRVFFPGRPSAEQLNALLTIN